MDDLRLHARINLLEQMADQQERLNALLIDITGRLNQEQPIPTMDDHLTLLDQLAKLLRRLKSRARDPGF